MHRLGWIGAVVLGFSVASSLGGGCGGGDTEQQNSTGIPGDDAGVTVILDGGGEAATPPDGVAACPDGACNYQTSEGCSGAAPSCIPSVDPLGNPVPGCQPAGKGLSKAFCDDSTDCAPGYVCFGKSCRKLCCGGDWTGCPSPKEHCIDHVTFDGTTRTGAMLCYDVDTCDPLVPTSCTQVGKTCQLVDPTGVSGCAVEGTGETGQPCPCKGGFLCVSGKCRRLCKAIEGGGEPYCQPGEGICVHFTRDPEGVGECTP